jgi:hypothetical protein
MLLLVVSIVSPNPGILYHQKLSKGGTYQYFDKRETIEFLEIRTVVPSDEFTGFLRDMI